MTLTVNQTLVILLILVFAVMAAAVIVLVVNSLKLVKTAKGVVDSAEVAIDETKDKVIASAGELVQNTDMATKVAAAAAVAAVGFGAVLVAGKMIMRRKHKIDKKFNRKCRKCKR